MPYSARVLAIVETRVFSRKADSLLSDEERGEIAAFIAQNPTAGSVIRGSGGVRKIRWARAGSGKSSGARSIYYNQLLHEEIWLLTLYAKTERETVSARELSIIKEAIERG